jgi:peptide subunit release factor RF-3
MSVFESGSERRPQDFETIPITDTAELTKRFGFEIDNAFESMELATGASPTFDKEAFLAGKQTPVFFGSGVNNFGVMEVLDALIDLAPSPGPRTSSTSSSTSSPWSSRCSPRTKPSAAWCSRCRPTWMPTTATALPLCAWHLANTHPA